MESSLTLHTPHTLQYIDATISEESSYNLHTKYESYFPFHVKYDNSKYNLEELVNLINNFAIFHAKIKLSSDSKQSIASPIPIEVFRYKLLEDGSWYSVNTAPSKHKDGQIVEGALWSNGLFCIIRDENQILDAALYIDQYTKDFHKYP